MMNIKEKIAEDIKKAMQEKNELLLLVLRGINAVVQNKEIAKKDKLTEEEMLQVISSEAKKRKDSIEGFKKGGRDELVKKEEQELEILKKYLPEQMGEEQITEEVKKVIGEVGATGPQDTGKVMGPLMAKLKGKADGGMVGKIVGELLKNE
jgi:hypothetical protein